MENLEEEEIARRWKFEQAEKAERGQQRLLTNGEAVDVMEMERLAPKRRKVFDLSVPLESEGVATSRKRTRERRA